MKQKGKQNELVHPMTTCLTKAQHQVTTKSIPNVTAINYRTLQTWSSQATKARDKHCTNQQISIDHAAHLI
jgi:hypothetical protein